MSMIKDNILALAEELNLPAEVLPRLGALEFEYGPSEQGPCPWIQPGDPSLHVHIPSDASLTREALDDSYARARRFFSKEGAVFCGGRPPKVMVCGSWLLAPALQRAVKARLAAGGKIGSAWGALREEKR
ncbi:MAG: hypothetical protein K2N78_07675 [Oscillospiraceae bacterium]|nr:hypothetical protein [Oscillospiraceae bacterium]